METNIKEIVKKINRKITRLLVQKAKFDEAEWKKELEESRKELKFLALKQEKEKNVPKPTNV